MLDGARTRKAALAAAKRFPWMGRSGRGMARPCELEPGTWIELHQGSHGILVRMKMLLEACGFPLGRASLEYEDVISGNKNTRMVKSAPRSKAHLKSTDKSLNSHKTERIGMFARRMFAKAFNDGIIPRADFFDCLDNKKGTKRVLGLVPGGQPLFSRGIMKVGKDLRSWTTPFPSGFGFPVFVNSQWRNQYRGKLDALLMKWGIEDCLSLPSAESFVQQTLFGNPKPKQMLLFSASNSSRKRSSRENIGAYAKRRLYAALADGCVPDDDFNRLKTYDGTVALLGISLSRCPLFSNRPIITDSGIHSWADPAQRNGRPVYVCEEWYAHHRSKLDKLLDRWIPKSNSTEPKPSEKIGTFAKREIFKALSDDRVPDEDFSLLSTPKGTRSLLGLRLKGCPLFSATPIHHGKHLRTWANPAKRKGELVFVSNDWYNTPDDWNKLQKLLARWDKKSMSVKKDLPSQIEEFYDGVFSSNDFWEYASEIYGLDTTPAAKAAQIRCLVQRFIRLDREHWISVSNFRRLSDWDVVKESAVTDALNSILRDDSFFPFALIPETVLSSFPSIRLAGNLLPWTRELAASIAALLVPAVHVANLGVVPQTLTALLVQTPIPDDAVLDMALTAYCDRFPEKRSIKGAFDFLRDNFVRSRFTSNLETEIREFLASHTEGVLATKNEITEGGLNPETMPDNSDENEKLLDDWADGTF